MNAIAVITPANDVAPTFADWLGQGKALLDRRNAVEWELADWLATGRETFGNQAAFDFLADELGIAPQRLKASVKTASVFPPHLRDRALTFDHHESVANLPVTDALDVLKTAREQHWDDKETRVAAVRRRAEIAPSLLPEEDWEQAELMALTRAWNRARSSVRSEFMDMAEEANGGVIDA